MQDPTAPEPHPTLPIQAAPASAVPITGAHGREHGVHAPDALLPVDLLTRPTPGTKLLAVAWDIEAG